MSKTPTVDTRRSPAALWHSLPTTSVRLAEDGFWARWQALNASTSLRHGLSQLGQWGNLDNLRLAAGGATGSYQGPVFMDSDVYKWLEAVALATPQGVPADVRSGADLAIRRIEAAQGPDGYLNSYYTVVAPERRWQELPTGHELYCLGHLVQAAVAWERELGDGRLLRVAERMLELVLSSFLGRADGLPGHPEIELALVELYRQRRRVDYLELARTFLDRRGHGLLGANPRFGGSSYYQDRVPVRDADHLEGHAVRALYLACGAADVYLETGDTSLLTALERQWQDMVARRMYLTGGVGSRHNGEAFGHAYELPPERAYCETCAAIGSGLWSWRLLQATGQARYADLIERTLFNSVLSGVGLDGTSYFYVNPLLNRGLPEPVGRGEVHRQPWYRVACCPPNVMRTLAAVGQYVATSNAEGIQVHLYAAAQVSVDRGAGDPIRLDIDTRYPWQGQIRLQVGSTSPSAWELRLRVPGWCTSHRLRLNQTPSSAPLDHGYLVVRRQWQAGDVVELDLAMPPRLTAAHPRVDAVHDMLAIERGPLVYCLEQADQVPGVEVLDALLDPAAPIEVSWRPQLLGGVVALRTRGAVVESPAELYAPFGADRAAREAELLAIPYWAWANRTPGAMRVWTPHHRP